MQHAAETDVRPRLRESAVVQDSQKEQQQTSNEHATHHRLPTAPPKRFVQRKDNRCSYDEQKQRKDQIVETEPFPFDVGKLSREKRSDGVWLQLIQSFHHRSRADNPEHVEAAESID